MNNKRKPATTSDHDTVLARINDPAPTATETPEELERQEPHERIDDRTVLAKINSSSKAGDKSNKGDDQSNNGVDAR